MCLILFAWQSHPDYALIVAANRDEFYARPSAPLGWWNDAPDVLAGRDLAETLGSAGTWMGMTTAGRFAAVTNVRSPSERRMDARTRGELTARYLQGEDDPETYVRRLAQTSRAYNGFNLLVGDSRQLWWVSNRAAGEARALKPGLYGLSNHLLNTPWPKVCRGVGALAEIVAADRGQIALREPYFSLLRDTRQASDADLPQTGVSLEWERLLSSAFICSPSYGTRASTILKVRHDGTFDMSERQFDANGVSGTRSMTGQLALVSQSP